MRATALLLAALTGVVFPCVHTCAQSAHSPYISHVYEYVPAPGQFVGAAYPSYTEGETEADILARVDSLLSGAPGTGRMVGLGAWGGYVVFGFDHPVVNVAGDYDLRIHGNAFLSSTKDGYQYGSCEPGIVYVSRDTNGDGIPNDPWYELAGSEFSRTTTDYEVTYHRSTGDIAWEDNRGGSGFIYRNAFHTQTCYYPLWRTDTVYTLRGSLLPGNVDPDNQQSYTYDYGYVDVWPNTDDRSRLNLDWAVDSTGQSVSLTAIHFVRVQTGVMVSRWGNNGLNGEMSTEITGAEDLHPDATPSSLPDHTTPTQHTSHKYLRGGQFFFCHDEKTYNAAGVLVPRNN